MNKRLLLIPVVLLSLSSCSNKPINQYRINSVYKTILEKYFDFHKEEYIEQYYNDEDRRQAAIYITGDKDWYPSVKDLGIYYSFGEYDGAYVFIPYFLTITGGYNNALTSFEICDGVIIYTDIDLRYFNLQVYKDSNFYDFKTAYEQNIVDLDVANAISEMFTVIYYDRMYSNLNQKIVTMAEGHKTTTYYLGKKLVEKFNDYLLNKGYKEKDVKQTEWVYVFELIGDISICLFDNKALNLRAGYDYEYKEEINGHEITFNSNYTPYVIHDNKNDEYDFYTLKEGYDLGYLTINNLLFFDKVFEFDKKGLIGYWGFADMNDYFYKDK